MRWLWFGVSLVVLMFLTCHLWLYRFESRGAPTKGLGDWVVGMEFTGGVDWSAPEGEGGLKLEVSEANPTVVQMVPLGEVRKQEWLHLDVELAARDLVVGKQKWDDGRLLLEWLGSGGGIRRDAIASARDSHRVDRVSLVVPVRDAPARAVARVENLGKSGELRVTRLDVTNVQERRWWRPAAAVVALLWLGMGIAVARSIGKTGWLRSGAVGGIWLLALYHFVLPGPWAICRPIGKGFVMGPIGSAEAVMDAHRSADLEAVGENRTAERLDALKTKTEANGSEDIDINRIEKLPTIPLAVTPAGEIGIQGSLVLRVKAALIWARPLLHIGLLMVPTLGFALLAGRRVAILLSASVAVLIESMQVLFGFGFDWMDCLDLLYDAAGIGLGCWLAVWLSRRWAIFYAAKTCVPAIHRGIQDSGKG